MNLDAELGTGATEAFISSVTFSDDQPTIVFGEWEDVPPVPVQVSGIDITPLPGEPWPSAGVWQSAYVVWADSSVQILFKDGVMFWGNGICSAEGGHPGERLDRLGNYRMWDFLSEYITVQRIDVPNVPAFCDPFLKSGFEIFETVDTTAKFRSVPSRIFEWIDWLENGADPNSEPEWRANV